MISNPSNGWCDFKIGDFVGHPSYVMDTPADLLECFIEYFHKGSGSAYIDEEGTDFTFVVSDAEVYIITFGKDGNHRLVVLDDYYPNDLAVSLVYDIENHFDEWVLNFYGCEDGEKYNKEESEELRSLLNTLKEKMRKRGLWDDEHESKIVHITEDSEK